VPDVGAELFHRGLCLPSDNKLTPDQQDLAIEAVKRCFG
jgi:dTDP-4-amino-4,6-dideoxygalactose transaminase